MNDHTVFVGFNQKMMKLNEPKGNPERANFVITYKGMDWSGFRTLAECEKQFSSLENSVRTVNFAVVER